MIHLKIYIRHIIILMLLFHNYELKSQETEQRQNSRSSLYHVNKNIDKATPRMSREINKTAIREYLNISDEIELVKNERKSTKNTESNILHDAYSQYYNGLLIESSDIRLHFKEDSLVLINGELLQSLDMETIPRISKEAAFQYALDVIDAEKYMWEMDANEKNIKKDSSFIAIPKGELVLTSDYISNSNKIKLAYKFDIYAEKPLRRDYVYIDANNGDLVRIKSLLNEVNGNAETRYSGTKTVSTDLRLGKYELHDLTRGDGIRTYNLSNHTSLIWRSNFKDDDNNWTSLEYDNFEMDNAALDAHWGLMKTYDYFSSKHNRNSFDNDGSEIKAYVHYDFDLVNAYWTGSELLLGDGNGSEYDPLASIDILAHEFGHGICNETADLDYELESGAINEGLSDIWGACVEYFAAPTDPNKDTWTCGEEIDKVNSGLRSMRDPNLTGQPDTYGDGSFNWVSTTGCIPDGNNNDFCGVHTNSGVLNYWFYLLSEGGSGVNDNGDAYNVSGISIENAAKIVYETETGYLTSTSDFQDFRAFSRAATKDIFDPCGIEIESVTNAWHAVGVGDIYTPSITLYSNQTVNIAERIVDCIIEVDNVIVPSGTILILDYADQVTINQNFKVELGASLIIE